MMYSIKISGCLALDCDMNFKKISLTQLIVKFFRVFGAIIFHFPSIEFKISFFGVICLILTLLYHLLELLTTFDLYSSYYFGPSQVLNTINMISIPVYGLHYCVAAIFNVIQAKKLFKVFKEIESIEENVILTFYFPLYVFIN